MVRRLRGDFGLWCGVNRRCLKLVKTDGLLSYFGCMYAVVGRGTNIIMVSDGQRPVARWDESAINYDGGSTTAAEHTCCKNIILTA